MTEKERNSVVEIYYRIHCGYSDAGVSFSEEQIPNYGHHAKSCPSLCRLAEHSGSVRKECLKFYRDLPETDFQKLECPHGFVVCYAKATISGTPVTLGRVEGISERGLSLAKINTYPREDKKHAIETARTDSARRFSQSISSELTTRTLALAEAITLGTLAVAIRGFSHELLTPVQGLLNEINEFQGSGRLPADIATALTRHLQVVASTTKKIQVIISAGLELSPRSLRLVTIAKMLHRVASQHETAAQEKHILIDIAANRICREIHVVPDLMQLALSCLIENAIKYSFSGTPERANYVNITFTLINDKIVVHIKNTGCLITADELKTRAIFRLGARGAYSNDRDRRGTGSGLFIAEQVIAAHGGYLDAVSFLTTTTSQGDPIATTIFSAALPIHPDVLSPL